MSVSAQVIDQYVDLVQRVVNLRVDFLLPEHLVRFKQQMEAARGSAGSWEDYTFLFRILTILAQSETPPTMRALSTRLNLPFSSATRIVDWLVRAQLVERSPDPRDRRMIHVQLTPAGQQLYQISMDYHKQQIAQVLSSFSATEQAQLLRLLNKLFDVMTAKE